MIGLKAYKVLVNKRMKKFVYFLLMTGCLSLSNASFAIHYAIEGNSDFEKNLFKAIAKLQPGDKLELPKGRFSLSKEIVFVVRGVEIFGQGKADTILDFSNQKQGAQGILGRANNLIFRDFSLKNTNGDALVVRGAKTVTIKNLDVLWVPNVKSKKSAGYGIYPVLSKNIVVENCSVEGAIEAGIYVGQSKGAVVVGNSVKNNTVGIDIENSIDVEVVNNKTTQNSIGIVVSKRPHLVIKSSSGITIKGNDISSNNRANNAPEHSLVAEFGHGVGLVVMASEKVSVKENIFFKNVSSHISVLSFPSTTAADQKDPVFSPYVSNVELVSNKYVHADSESLPVVGKIWTDAKSIDVQWDGVSREFRSNQQKTLCINGNASLVYVNRSNDLKPRKLEITKQQLICNPE